MRTASMTDMARDACHALAPKGSPQRAALVRVLRDLQDERVPLVGPRDRAVPHGPNVMGRAVPGTDLLVCYVPGGNEVFVVNVVRAG